MSTERREIVIFRSLEGLGDAINPLGIHHRPPGFKRLGALAAEPGLPFRRASTPYIGKGSRTSPPGADPARRYSSRDRDRRELPAARTVESQLPVVKGSKRAAMADADEGRFREALADQPIESLLGRLVQRRTGFVEE